MPANHARGEDGMRIVLAELPFTQLPNVALALSDAAFQVLGAIVREAGSRSSVEVTDQVLGQAIFQVERPPSRGRPRKRPFSPGRSVGTVQRALVELEGAGLIERQRRYGRRTILLLYTLAGREARSQPKGRTKMINALSAGAQRTQRGGSTHSAQALRPAGPPGPPSFEGTSGQQQQAGCAGDGVVAPLSHDAEDQDPPGRNAFLAGMVADLGQILTSGAKRQAPGSRANDPREPGVRHSVPDAKDCSPGVAQPSRSEHGTGHNSR
jgi:hypothetical protein